MEVIHADISIGISLLFLSDLGKMVQDGTQPQIKFRFDVSNEHADHINTSHYEQPYIESK